MKITKNIPTFGEHISKINFNKYKYYYIFRNVVITLLIA